MVQLNFDASTVAPASAPEPLETGWYPANIIMTEQKPTKNNDGGYLEITNRISTGQYAGRTLKDRLNLWNKSQQAVDIAYSQLSAITHATAGARGGNLRIGVAAEFHGAPLEVYVKKVPRDDKPDLMTNEVAGYRAPGAHGAQPGFSGAPPAAAPAWAGTQPTPNNAGAVNAGWAPPPVAAPAAPAAVQPQPTWQPPQPATNTAPPPAAQPPAAAPAAAGNVPPWAR